MKLTRTPGFIVPSAYSSMEELEKDLRRRDAASGFTPFDPSEFVDDVIEHYGVKGMKWGVRRAELNAPNSRYSSANRERDRMEFGDRGVKRINRRMNSGMTRKKAVRREIARTVGKSALAGLIGSGIIAAEVMGYSVRTIATRAETNRGRNAAANAMGLPRRASTGPTYTKPNRRGVYNITSL